MINGKGYIGRRRDQGRGGWVHMPGAKSWDSVKKDASYLSLELYLLLVIIWRVPLRQSCLSPVRDLSSVILLCRPANMAASSPSLPPMLSPSIPYFCPFSPFPHVPSRTFYASPFQHLGRGEAQAGALTAGSGSI